jgi:hypothetical protein
MQNSEYFLDAIVDWKLNELKINKLIYLDKSLSNK